MRKYRWVILLIGLSVATLAGCELFEATIEGRTEGYQSEFCSQMRATCNDDTCRTMYPNCY